MNIFLNLYFQNLILLSANTEDFYTNMSFIYFIFLGLFIFWGLINKFYEPGNNYKDINEISYNNIIPNVTMKDIKKQIEEMYINYNLCITRQDYNQLLTLIDNSLFNSLKSKLISLNLQNKQKVIENLKIKKIKIINLRNDNDILSMECYLETSCFSYTINKISKKLTNGSQYLLTEEKVILHLVKYIGNNKLSTCPNCGNVENFSAKSKCKYCDTVLYTKPTKFVINKITKLQ